MNPQPPQPLRLHWIPVAPSWIISAGLILLAALPHQVPQTAHRLLANTIVRIMCAAATIYVWMKAPILGTAMGILLISMILMPVSEGFVITNLNHDRVKKKRTHWFIEDALAEEPMGIQERTEETNLNYDDVSDKCGAWQAENIMKENPMGIQDKPVPEYKDALR